MAFIALYDACVLYPAPLRDLLIRMAMTGLFQAKWSDDIHDEWIRNLARNRPELAEKLPRTRELMNAAVPDALVVNYRELIHELKLPDPSDRHVLAAAIAGHASVIVTPNLRHFPKEALWKFQIEAIHPDDFVASQFDLNPPVVVNEIKMMRAALRKPPQSIDDLIQMFSTLGLPQVAKRMEYFRDSI